MSGIKARIKHKLGLARIDDTIAELRSSVAQLQDTLQEQQGMASALESEIALAKDLPPEGLHSKASPKYRHAHKIMMT